MSALPTPPIRNDTLISPDYTACCAKKWPEATESIGCNSLSACGLASAEFLHPTGLYGHGLVTKRW